ncbi:alpha/beta fold hydrolase [Mycobacterium sp. PS03-16]|uniref:alpha/beta fold hydrolase n=1 Tax=Mycobacterium sp. PS03-16 TaxID=2559611 RepID=UPI0010740FB6|nr:alpha/beta hydrolase [Mycobacterium sp. PS03-16]TFV55275.1 alpha/beta fold hydrolase [Mycobacterium sp. PS03-16]
MIAEPRLRIAGRDRVGGFVSEAAAEHYLTVYRQSMAALPSVVAAFDVPTAFGTVRAYRFDGPAAGTPVLLLPGRNAATPMYRVNLPPLVGRRPVYGLDLLGEPGLSVQTRAITGSVDQADWLAEAIAGLDLPAVHLLGTSIGGWSAVNLAVRRPERVASLALLDPVMTFDRIPLAVLAAAIPLTVPGTPEIVRRRLLRWISGGADVDDTVPEARLIDAGTTDFRLRLPAPTRITDAQLRALDRPVLALLAGRSVMLRAEKAAARARRLVSHGQVEVWPAASHAINGEYPGEIAERVTRFWDEADRTEAAPS